jgi:hypothetical protein
MKREDAAAVIAALAKLLLKKHPHLLMEKEALREWKNQKENIFADVDAIDTLRIIAGELDLALNAFYGAEKLTYSLENALDSWRYSQGPQRADCECDEEFQEEISKKLASGDHNGSV